MFDDPAWSEIPLGTRRAVLGQHLSRILGDITSAAGSGGFDHPRAQVVCTPLELDAPGFDAVADILAETVQRVMAVRSTSNQRRFAERRDTARMELAIMNLGRP